MRILKRANTNKLKKLSISKLLKINTENTQILNIEMLSYLQ